MLVGTQKDVGSDIKHRLRKKAKEEERERYAELFRSEAPDI